MLVSSTPPAPEQYAEFIKETARVFEESIRGASSHQEKLEQLGAIERFAVLVIKDGSRRGSADLEVAQQGLEALWQMFLQTSQVIDADDTLHDRLVGLLLWTKEFDLACRAVHSNSATPLPDWESYGFARSLQSAWERLVATNSAAKLGNLAAFSAKCLRTGLHAPALGLTALWYLRESLETDDEAAIKHRLSAAAIWIEHSREKLLTFSSTGQLLSQQASVAGLAAPGSLARAADITRSAWSLERWLFWRKRLQALTRNTEPAVAEAAKRGFLAMVTCGRDLGLDVPGEAKFVSQLQAAMAEALAASGNPSVEIDEIEVVADWVD